MPTAKEIQLYNQIPQKAYMIHIINKAHIKKLKAR
jgi:hypothetical protein